MSENSKKFDVIVVGAGHAGIEACLSVARCGYQVLLLTMDKEAIGRMSCNPAIGGLAKGHVVREIDALGGEMAKAIDATGIQFRMLNRSKGPAVWAPRAQADKNQYSLYMRRIIEAEKNIHLVQGQAVELLVENGKCLGIREKAGREFLAECTIITTGTFMQGLIHVGDVNYPGGRRDEAPSVGLSASMAAHGLEVIRFKTGTPPRLRANTINWAATEEQLGDNPPSPFSYQTKELKVEQMSCFMTYTNEKTHEIIRENLHRSPLYAGRIKSTGPRYCPSIEDKVVKFQDKTRHQIYLEPEGRGTDEVYVNGLSTSLPKDVQLAVIHSIHGLENAEIVRWGYAIEYDCFPPTQLKHSLETKKIENLFLAGQINCTSGYEEAAGQGLVAGLNAVRRLRSEEVFVLDRSEAYIGVLIDDLVTRGTNEPYRLFTSRAEYRLVLRQDNADERLMKYGFDFGLIPKEIYEESLARTNRVREEVMRLKSTRFQNVTLDQFLRRPEVNFKSMTEEAQYACELMCEDEILRVETEVKYEGYITRQFADIQRFKKYEKKQIPENFDYALIKGMSREAREKLSRIRPASIGQASRIPGLSPCDLSLLAVSLGKISKLS